MKPPNESMHLPPSGNMKVVYARISPKHIKIVIVVIIVIVLSFIWFMNSRSSELFGSDAKNRLGSYDNGPINHVVQFSNDVLKYDDFRRLCYKNTDPKNIEDLNIYILMLKKRRHILCQNQYKFFNYIYQFRIKFTTIDISKTFMLKVRKWLKDNQELIEAAKNQSIIFIDNKYTSESVVFNPVRSNRPGVGAGNTMNYIKDLVEKTSKSCDFCSYVNNTAADSFGRMETKLSVIISNTFKIDRYHGLALMKTHNPLFFTQLQFIDCMDLTMQWFSRVSKLTPSHLYRIMYWDILPKSSASQVHPHIHLTLGDDAYYAKWNHLHKSAMRFSRHHSRLNYWNTVLQIHTSLGLSVSFGKASLFAYLTPQKDFEVMLISAEPCLDFFRLAYFTMRAFIDDLSQYALSMGFAFPKINSDAHYGDEIPMLMRIVSRGPADNPRSDISSFDLFGTPNVNKDPFKLIKRLRESIKRRTEEKFEFEWRH